MVRIAINTLFLQPGRGRGTQTYVVKLLEYLGTQSDVEVTAITYPGNHAIFSNIPGVRSVVTPITGARRVMRVIYEQMRLPRLARAHGADVLFCPGYLAPVTRLIPTVVTIHDMQYRDIPQGLPLSFRFAYRALVPRGARAAKVVVTVSEFSKQRILHYIGIPEHRVRVSHLGALDVPAGTTATIDVRAKFQLSGSYILSVSSALPHKNTARLIASYQKLPETFKSLYPLVLVGQLSPGIVPNSDNSIRSLGYVSTADLAALYSGAHAFILPSLYEGFGLPVIEAMQRSVPVACANAGSLPEIAGAAAVLFDPFDEDDMVRSLENICRDGSLRASLKTAAARNLARFSWESCGARTKEWLCEAAKQAR